MTLAMAPLLLTMGDACGIGPEILVKFWLEQPQLARHCIVVGDPDVMRRALEFVGAKAWHVHVVSEPLLRPAESAVLPVWCPVRLEAGLSQIPVGGVDARSARASVVCIEAAVQALHQQQGRGIVTAPIHKAAWHLAGVAYPGHTEMLQVLAAQLWASGQQALLLPVRMMLTNDQLRVVLVTVHQSLRQAIDALTVEGIVQTLRITDKSLRALVPGNPRIAVAGLNPHAGENGLFGDEEIRLIGPAIEQARLENMDVQGPFAPDTVFMRARHAPPEHPAEFDVVVAMTHDHGLIPVKYLGVDHGVNVTLGLPFVRTSPDHGTAFDLAGTGLASAASLTAAVRMASQLTNSFK
jgi:4-hydroxythreonine-4-phosphate dehydrogenase